MRRDVGFVILGASILDDTIGWVILAIVVRVAGTGRFGAAPVAVTLAATGGFALFAMLVLRPIASRAIRWLERGERLEYGTTSAVVVLTLACGALAGGARHHPAAGGENPRSRPRASRTRCRRSGWPRRSPASPGPR